MILFCRKYVAGDGPRWIILNFVVQTYFFCCNTVAKSKRFHFGAFLKHFFLCCNAALLACNAKYHIAGTKKILKVVPEFWYILSELYYTLFSNGCCNPTKHGAIIQTGTKCKKTVALCKTQLSGRLLLKTEKMFWSLCETFLKFAAAKRYRIFIGLCKQSFRQSPNRNSWLKK